ncbi:DUF3501 family protein [Luteimonas sp. 50]|uniref:DUF3501 family protein n=1 Tax=Cognatiluteimonas sedimenti TaxID=2927791 RepID=A0ABT0A352_9GAMM|nr:DUF3501 family protein [Lysobacter sedimenti]MCJ0825406.1 DUF3501 family protein [Lysobacter sedimenti]
MQKLTRADLLSLERYAAERVQFRARAIAHKRARTLHLGEHATLLFEDRLTVQYQVQEMLRVERIFEAAGIDGELAAYNPLIPDGGNLKATVLFEYTDEAARRRALATLGGIEHRFFAGVEGFPPIPAHADEDLDRSTDAKTSAVHFLRFEFAPDEVAGLRGGAGLSFGIDDPRMPLRATVGEPLRSALLADFD